MPTTEPSALFEANGISYQVKMVDSPRDRAIRERAYAIWEHAGRPCGEDVNHWLSAEAEIALTGYVVMQGPGFTIARSQTAETAIPYGAVDRPDGRRNHGFIDLRDHPERALVIPEAWDSVAMQAVLWALNAPGFRFMSLGCERGLFPRRKAEQGQPPYFCGGYIQVAYRDGVLNSDPHRFIALAQRVLSGIAPNTEHHIGFEMIVEPLRSFFGAEGCYTLVMKPFGYGASNAAALAAWEHAASAIAAVFTHLQGEAGPYSGRRVTRSSG